MERVVCNSCIMEKKVLAVFFDLFLLLSSSHSFQILCFSLLSSLYSIFRKKQPKTKVIFFFNFFLHTHTLLLLFLLNINIYFFHI